MTNPFRRGAAASLLDRGEAEVERPSRRGEVTGKPTSEAHHVVGVGMFGRQGGVSGETCGLTRGAAGVRARTVLQRREPREVRVAKPD